MNFTQMLGFLLFASLFFGPMIILEVYYNWIEKNNPQKYIKIAKRNGWDHYY